MVVSQILTNVICYVFTLPKIFMHFRSLLNRIVFKKATRMPEQEEHQSAIGNPTFYSSLLTKANIFKFPVLRWRPTSSEELEKAESSILQSIKHPFKQYFVDIGPDWNKQENLINTIELCNDVEIKNGSTKIVESKQPILMIHGFGAGLGFWILNYDFLASNLNRKIYAIDILGFGRSSRTSYNLKEDIEEQFVDSIERWRKKMGISKFIILGHSFGGYLSANYALKHPDHVSQVILADPWGIQERPPEDANRAYFRLPLHVRMINSIFQSLNPLSILRVSGPYGPRLVHTFRSDIKEKFTHVLKENSYIMLDYIYHCNAQYASGETAFKKLTISYGWAKNPLASRLIDIDKNIMLTFIYGSRSWIDKSSGELIRECLGADRVNFYSVNGAGHHVYADKCAEFNDIVVEVCSKTN